MTKNVLVFAPHPDDDIIGCGGSIIKHVKAGNNVSIAYVTSGEAGSLRYSKKELASIREKEAHAGAQELGVTDLHFLRQPDGYLFYDESTIIMFINLIRKLRPNIIYVPHDQDGHKDHSTTCKIVTEAVSRAAGPWFQECSGGPFNVGSILCYEVWTPLQQVTYIEDISDVIDQKIKALEQHVSQVQDISYHDGVKGLNRYRGTMTGKGIYCECFHVIRSDLSYIEAPNSNIIKPAKANECNP